VVESTACLLAAASDSRNDESTQHWVHVSAGIDIVDATMLLFMVLLAAQHVTGNAYMSLVGHGPMPLMLWLTLVTS
jgi:hypothetical protein